MSADSIKYLERVAVADSDTWFNVHHTAWNKAGKLIIPGAAHQTIASAIRDMEYWRSKGCDIYLAQGVYRNPGQHYPGKPYPTALRQRSNIVACRCLYMDIDVKPGAYETTEEAANALIGFHKFSGMPLPPVIVQSGGGGLHPYWTLNALISLAEFDILSAQLVAAALAFGLKFDTQCTVDATRLLRFPGTWNYKHDPANPVLMPRCEDPDCDLDAIRTILGAFKPTLTPRVKPKTLFNVSKVWDGVDVGSLGDEPKFPPVNIDDAAKNCPFIADTLATGGADYQEPLWKQCMNIAAACVDPEQTAIRLSKGHAGYNEDDTLAKLAAVSTPPPFCATMDRLTHQCKTCPHLSAGTTPLAARFRQTNGHTYSGKAAKSEIDLPAGYYRADHDFIYKQIEGEEKCVFEHQVIPYSAYIEAVTGEGNFLTFKTMDAGDEATKSIPCKVIGSSASFGAEFAEKLMPIRGEIGVARTFFMSYMMELKQSKQTLINAPAFGWSQNGEKQMGFSYAGRFFSPAGEARAARPGVGAEHYRTEGTENTWRELADIVLTPDRPDLCIVVASSFGSPLVFMGGHPGITMGIVSGRSGIGKSTALKLGQSVWSKPIVGGLNDTVTYTFAKFAALRHIGVFYDEIKGEKQFRNMVDTVFQITGGHEKGRANRVGAMREVREFNTLLGYASNQSVVAAVREQDPGTDASWLRMFEIQGIVKPNRDEDFAATVNEHITALNLNYGSIGERYAEYLGKNHETLSKTFTGVFAKVRDDLGADPKLHRYWIAAITTTLMGALIANREGYCKFPIGAMSRYMYSEFRRMRAEMKHDPGDYGSDDALANVIGTFLAEKTPRNLVHLDKTWTGKNRPPNNFAKVLNEKTDTAWGTYEVQISGSGPTALRIDDKSLNDWCKKNGVQKAAIVEQLKKKLGAYIRMLVIGSGSFRRNKAPTNVWAIDDVTGTALDGIVEYAAGSP